MSRLRRAFAAIAVTVLLSPRRMEAQDTTRTARDTTHADSTRGVQRIIALPRLVVSGTRLAADADPSAPQRADRIPVDRARAAGVAGAADLLRRVGGVSASNDQGSRGQPTLDVRGFTLSPVVGVPQGVSVFLDGVRVNEPDAQEVNFDLLPMEAVERAELQRGTTAIFGKNSLAGAINLHTLRGSGAPTLRGSVEAGPYGERTVHALATRSSALGDALLMASAGTEGGYQAQSGGTSRKLFATVGRRGEERDLALSVLYARDRLYEAGSLPESWLAVAPRANYTGGDFFAPELVQLALRGERSVRGVHLRGNLFGRRNAIEQLNVNAGSANTHAFVRNASAGGTGEIVASTTMAGRPLDLSVGLEAAHAAVRYRVLAETNAAGVDPPSDCDAASGATTALCENARAITDDAALYAQANLEASSRVRVLLSARGDYSRVPFRDLREPRNDGTSTFRRLSPRIGVRDVLTRDVSVYASAGSAFRTPAPLELACASADAACPLPFSLGADPPLAPVVAWSYETGAELARAGGTMSVSLFDTEVRNEIVFVSAGRAAGYFQNIARSRRRGLELAGSLLLAQPAIRLFGAYSLVDATYGSTVALASPLDDNVVTPGSRFPLSPRHRATLGAEAEHAVGRTVVGVELAARAVSSAFLRGDEANRERPLGGYGVADLRVSARRDRLVVTAYVDNLLDRRYSSYGVYAENPKGPYGGPAPATPAVERFFTPAYPRTVRVSLSLDP